MFTLIRKMKKREWFMAIICALLVLAQIFFDLKLPDFMSDLTILIKTEGSRISDILLTGLKMLVCTLISATLAVACGFLASKTAAGLSLTIRSDIFKKVSEFGQEEMLQFSVPSLINRTTNDITQIQMFIAIGLQLLIKAPVMAVWAIIKIVNKSLNLSLITAAFVVAILSMMAVVIVVVVPRFRKVQKLTDNVNLVARENLTGLNVIHAFNAEDYQNSKFEEANSSLMKTQLFNQRTFAIMMPFVNFAMNALSLVILWVGASIVNSVPATDIAMRVSTFGDIVVFGTYASYVVMSLMMLVMIFMFLPAAQVSATRINQVLKTNSSLMEGDQTRSSEKGSVEFRNVSFHYPSSDKNVLEDISFSARRGETVAIIGATGSGKTTLVGLIARFYDVTSGEVLVDGVNVKDYSFDALYDRVGFITQKPVLFSASVKDNVLFGESNGKNTQDNAEQALDIAQASDFVDKMPNGINSPIAQGGANLSGGQKQRISIARAIAREPEILVFDDSFSALDYKTDALLRKELGQKLKHTTKIIVAQRIGTIRNADKIIVLDEGQSVGVGTHDELLASCEVYREIAMSQLSAEELEN